MLPCDPAFPPNPTGGYGIRPYGQDIALSIKLHGRTLFAPTFPHKRLPLRVTPHSVGRCRAATEGPGRVSGASEAQTEGAAPALPFFQNKPIPFYTEVHP